MSTASAATDSQLAQASVESDLYNSNYFHSTNTYTSDSNRYTITQYHLGMPDLNTSNSYVQQRVLGLLEECVDLGVDGFRFDAAKHIELPTDTSSGCASDFRPTVLNGIDSYTSNDLYNYGEILNYAGTDISNYTEYLGYSTSYNTTYNERGTLGVVISKLNGSGYVSLTAHKMADGTYTD